MAAYCSIKSSKGTSKNGLPTEGIALSRDREAFAVLDQGRYGQLEGREELFRVTKTPPYRNPVIEERRITSDCGSPRLATPHTRPS
jgi:hypothetical protein